MPQTVWHVPEGDNQRQRNVSNARPVPRHAEPSSVVAALETLERSETVPHLYDRAGGY
jgi:hypothetical protein